MIFVSRQRAARLGCALGSIALLSNACAGKAESNIGYNAIAGSSATSGAASSSAGASAVGEAGATNSEGGSSGGDSAGGRSAGGSAGGPSSAGTAPVLQCDKVICPSIPTTCKRVVQDPKECCPSCPDTGCDVCPDLECAEGTHGEVAPGDCCRTCVADPPDACVEGQKAYETLRQQLLAKYGSGSCKNSAECSLVKEDNRCASGCNVALPTQSISNWTNNLNSNAKSNCASCPAPAQIECNPQVAACVNGKCIGVDAP